MKTRSVLLCILILLVSAYSKRRVLILNSYHLEFEWTGAVVEEIKNELAQTVPGTEIYTEFMDTKRFYSDEYLENSYKLLKQKYRGTPLDVIITTDDNAAMFLSKYKDDLFAEVPVVFCGINDLDIETKVDRTHFTGVLERQHPGQTLELIQQLQPGITEIYLLSDYSSTGNASYSAMKKVDHDFPSLTFRRNKNSSFDAILNELTQLDRDKAIFLMAYFTDSTGKYFSYEDVMNEINAVAACPVYCVSEFYLGKGVVGGAINSSSFQGKSAVKIVRQIFDGQKPEEIPIVADFTDPLVVDDKALLRFDIPLSRVPIKAKVINKKATFVDFYRNNRAHVLTLIVGMLGIIVVVLSVSVFNIWQINRKRLEVIGQLQEALSQVEQLEGLLPICANCHKIRDDSGYWSRVEEYIPTHSKAKFTHSLCPSCIKEVYPELADEMGENEV